MLEQPHTTWASVVHREGQRHVAEAAARRMTLELCGLEADVSRLWYVLEQDLMALAVDGRWTRFDAPLGTQGCS